MEVAPRYTLLRLLTLLALFTLSWLGVSSPWGGNLFISSKPEIGGGFIRFGGGRLFYFQFCNISDMFRPTLMNQAMNYLVTVYTVYILFKLLLHCLNNSMHACIKCKGRLELEWADEHLSKKL